MLQFYTLALYAASALTLCAALLHFICIFTGASGFRVLGAGKSITKMAEDGHWYPHFIAFVLGSMLMVFSLYAFYAAKAERLLPFTEIILPFIAGVLLLRGFAFPWLKSKFVGNSDLFWYVSSSGCIIFGALYAVGSLQFLKYFP